MELLFTGSYQRSMREFRCPKLQGIRRAKVSQLLEFCLGTLHCRVKSLAVVVQLDRKVHLVVIVNLIKKQVPALISSWTPLTSYSITFRTISGLINFAWSWWMAQMVLYILNQCSHEYGKEMVNWIKHAILIGCLCLEIHFQSGNYFRIICI